MLKESQRFFLTVIIVLGSCTPKVLSTADTIPEKELLPNRAFHWAKISLACTANDTENFNPRPTITSRCLALTWVAVFDAWTRYDAKAVPLYLTTVERRPSQEQTLKNKEIAISYAAYRAMLTYYFADSILLRHEMVKLGLDPNDKSLDPETPIGIGNLAAKTVIEARKNDGANQMGDMPNSEATPYADYTGYIPVNHADTLNDIAKWQPKYFLNKKGEKFAPTCLTPHWSGVDPLALDSASQFRPLPPPAIESPQLAEEVKEVIDFQSNLSDEQRALVEFMRDGPKSVQQAGHWLMFSMNISIRDDHTLDEDVRMYFLVEMTAMDAFIACWDSKMFYDFARPYALVHNFYQNKLIRAWGGPNKGMINMRGDQWRPYSPDTFLCPPFPSYVSGHSTVSAACAETLRLFTDSEYFGLSVKVVPGLLTEPDHTGDTVVLRFPTFTETAEMAGLSRVLGGYHIQSDNLEGLKLGRQVATVTWRKYLNHLNGDAFTTGPR